MIIPYMASTRGSPYISFLGTITPQLRFYHPFFFLLSLRQDLGDTRSFPFHVEWNYFASA